MDTNADQRLEQARQLLAQFKYAAALSEAEIALAELESDPQAVVEHAEAHSLAGEAAQELSRFPLAEEHLRHAVQYFDQVGDERQVLSSQLGIAECKMRQGNLPTARHTATKALLAATAERWPELSARALVCLGNVAWLEGEYAAGMDYLSSAQELFEQQNLQAEANRTKTSRAIIVALSGDTPKAAELFTEALDYFQQVGHFPLVIRTLNNLAGIAYHAGDYNRAREYLLQCVDMLVAQVEGQRSTVEIAYRRGVQPRGNPAALRLIDSVFEPCPARWRGMGTIPGSGLKLKSAYRRFDADHAFDIDPGPTREPEGCICGAILRGTSTPLDCGLFGKACTPTNPVGPCMVSAEGSCSTYYLYGGGSDVR